MSDPTRRTVLQYGGAAVGGSLLSLNLSGGSKAQGESSGVFHVFAFQWKPRTTEAQMDKAKKEIGAFQGAIPGLLETHVGSNLSPRAKGYTFGGVMRFKDQVSLETYFQHPAHLALLAWLVPLIDAVELDLRA